MEILAAYRAGVDYVLSLNSQNLDVASELRATPILIPDSPQDLGTLDRTVGRLEALGRPYILDPVIEPVGFGFAAGLDRYVQVRARYPAAEMLMGIGNITELTDADTTGMNALLIGFCQELGIRHVLTTEVIPWARGAVREVDVARRLMYAARRRGVLPKRIDDRLLTVKDSRPKSYTEPELRALHEAITDPNFRIATTRDAIYVFNNRLFVSGTDIQALFDDLGVEDPGHAFYLGRELMKARLALRTRQDLRAGAAAALGLPDGRARGHAPPPGPHRGPAPESRRPRLLRLAASRPETGARRAAALPETARSSRGSRRRPSSTTGGCRSGCRREDPPAPRIRAGAEPREIHRGQEHRRVAGNRPQQAVERLGLALPPPREALFPTDTCSWVRALGSDALSVARSAGSGGRPPARPAKMR